MNEVIAHFESDLSQAGVGARAVATLASLYRDALLDASDRAWTRLYRATFSTLRALARRPPGRIRQSHRAIESLLRLLEDDLGTALFGAPAVGRLRVSLMLDSNLAYLTAQKHLDRSEPGFIAAGRVVRGVAVGSE
jgi:hypothetical protein